MARSNLRKTFSLLSVLLIPLAVWATVEFEDITATKANIDNVQVDGNTISTTDTNGNLVIAPNGSGLLRYSPGTASTVPYLNATKDLVSSSVTPTELGYLGGVSSAIQTQLNAKPNSATLSDNRIIRGDGTSAIQSSGVTLTDGDAIQGATIDADANTLSNIDNGEIKAAAAIALNKLAAVTASRALVSDASGFVSASTATDTQLGYLANATSNICGISQSCTLTNKTLTEPTIDISIWDDQASTPSSPSSGFYKTYFKSDGKFYKLNSSGTETEIGSGSGGSGGINYVTNPDATSDTTGWTTYDDSAAAPVDMTSGTVSTTFTRSTTSNEQIRQSSIASGVFKLSKDAANRQGEGVRVVLDLDRIDYVQSRRIYVSFDYQTSSSFATDDICLYTYGVDTTNVVKLQSENNGCLRAANSKAGRFVGWFDTDPNDSDLRLAWHIATTNASAYDVFIDNVRVGPDVIVPGAIMTEWRSYPATITGFGTVSSLGAYSRRVGDLLEVQISFLTGTPTATQARISIGYEGTDGNVLADTTKHGASTITGYYILGSNNDATTNILMPGSDVAYVLLGIGASGTNNPASAANGNTIAGSGVSIQAKFSVPIVGWKSNAMMGTADLPYTLATANYSTAAGQSFTDSSQAIVDFGTVDTSTGVGDPLGLVTTGSSWKFTANRAMKVRACARVAFASSGGWGSTEQATLELFKNGSRVKRVAEFTSQGALTQQVPLYGCHTLYLVKSDYIDFRAQQNSGGTIALIASADHNYVNIAEESNLTAFQNYATIDRQYACTFSGPSGYSMNGTAKCIPYYTADGAWRMKFNLDFSLTAATSITLTTPFTCKSGMYQALSAWSISSNQTINYCRCQDATAEILCNFGSNTSRIIISGDVELNAKPSMVP